MRCRRVLFALIALAIASPFAEAQIFYNGLPPVMGGRARSNNVFVPGRAPVMMVDRPLLVQDVGSPFGAAFTPFAPAAAPMMMFTYRATAEPPAAKAPKQAPAAAPAADAAKAPEEIDLKSKRHEDITKAIAEAKTWKKLLGSSGPIDVVKEMAMVEVGTDLEKKKDLAKLIGACEKCLGFLMDDALMVRAGRIKLQGTLSDTPETVRETRFTIQSQLNSQGFSDVNTPADIWRNNMMAELQKVVKSLRSLEAN